MKLVLSFFSLLILILGILFFKIRIFAEDLDLEFIKFDLKKAKYNIKIGFYFLGFIKIASLSIVNGAIKLLFLKIKLSEIKNNRFYLKKVNPKIAKITKHQIISDISKINFRLDNLKLDLEFGTDSVFITSILVGIISAIISYLMGEYIEKFKEENYKWKVLPNFEEKFFVNFKANIKISYSPVLNYIIKNE